MVSVGDVLHPFGARCSKPTYNKAQTSDITKLGLAEGTGKQRRSSNM